MPNPYPLKRRPKHGTNIRMVIDMKQDALLAGMLALTEAVQSLTVVTRSLTETAARLEQQVARSTERFATMRRS